MGLRLLEELLLLVLHELGQLGVGLQLGLQGQVLSLRRILIEGCLEVLFGDDVVLHDFLHLHHTLTQTIQVITGLLKHE